MSAPPHTRGSTPVKKLWDTKGGLDDCTSAQFSFAADKSDCLKANPTQKTWEDYGLPDLRSLKERHASQSPEMIDAGKDVQDAWTILRETLGLQGKDTARTIITPTREVVIADWTLYHIIEKRDARRERYANFIQPALSDPLEVWKTLYEDGNDRERYIKLFTGKNDIYVVVRINTDGSLLWNAVPARTGTAQNQRQGELLWKAY